MTSRAQVMRNENRRTQLNQGTIRGPASALRSARLNDLLNRINSVRDPAALDRERLGGVARRADQRDLVRVTRGQVRRQLDVDRVRAAVEIDVLGDRLGCRRGRREVDEGGQPSWLRGRGTYDGLNGGRGGMRW